MNLFYYLNYYLKTMILMGVFVQNDVSANQLAREELAQSVLGAYHRHRIQPALQTLISYKNHFFPEDEINGEVLTLEETSSWLDSTKWIEEKDEMNSLLYLGCQEVGQKGECRISIYRPSHELEGVIEKIPSPSCKIFTFNFYNADHELVALGKKRENSDHQPQIILYALKNNMKGPAVVIMNKLSFSEGGGWEVFSSQCDQNNLRGLFCRFLASFEDIPTNVWSRLKMNRVVLAAGASATLGVSVYSCRDGIWKFLGALGVLLRDPSVLAEEAGEVVGSEAVGIILESTDGLLEGSIKRTLQYFKETPWYRTVIVTPALALGIWRFLGRRGK